MLILAVGRYKRLLDSLQLIVPELTAAGVATEDLMVVGAIARDIIHSAWGYEHTLPHTHDADLAIAVADLREFHSAIKTFPPVHSNGIGRRIADHPVDVTPFGPVESPAGMVAPEPDRPDTIVVFGFRDAFDKAQDLELPDGNRIKIPTPAGYTALASTMRLAMNIKQVLTQGNSRTVLQRWEDTDFDLLARHSSRSARLGWPQESSAQITLLRALTPA